jgi:Retrotransposon gag protein
MWGLGFWAETDPQHPNYTIEARPSSQLAGPQISQTQSTQSEPHEEFLSGGLHHIATLSEIHPLVPEPQNAPFTQHLHDIATTGSRIPTDIAPLAPHIDIMSGITAGMMITQNPAPPATPSNGGRGLYGTPPALFTGDRNKFKDFMRAFNRWWKLNKEKPVFSQPYKRVTLFLNHLRGLNVEDWADEQQKTMDNDIAAGHSDNDEHHWARFKVAFKQTYTDLGEKLSTDATLQNLRMEKGDIDTYITSFNKLLTQAGYKDDELGALNMFKKGLPGPLNVRIINNTSTAPQNLKDWQKAARE